MDNIRIGVGSKNPSKIRAAREAFILIYGGDIEIIPIDVPNTIRQPLSDNQMIQGAIYRANYALKNAKANLGVGMEGGLVRNDYGVFVKGWVAITDGSKIGLASTVSVQLPDYIWDIVVGGIVEELEDIMVKLTKIENIGDNIGAIGYMAQNKYSRTLAFRDAILCAYGRFSREELFSIRTEEIMKIMSKKETQR